MLLAWLRDILPNRPNILFVPPKPGAEYWTAFGGGMHARGMTRWEATRLLRKKIKKEVGK